MNLAGTEYTLKDKAFDIFISGCWRNCDGCCNPEAQSFDYGEPLNLKNLVDKIMDASELIDKIRVMGGDIACNEPYEAQKLIAVIAHVFPEKELWCFTGAEQHELPWFYFKYFDVIKCGVFDITKFVPGAFPASTNQYILRKAVNY